MERIKFYPKTRPYRKGHLQVSKTHKIYYEFVGNPKGKPVIFLHGGPGGCIGPKSRRWFDPKKFNVILFDQRGCGRSLPAGGLEENSAPELVKDIRKLVEFAGVKKFFVFGRSWGSTLALTYAVNHPETVRGLILGGVFLGTHEEVRQTFEGSRNYFPDLWEEFSSGISRKKDVMKHYLKKISSGTRRSRIRHARKWVTFNLSMMSLKPEKDFSKVFEDSGFESGCSVETHYIKNNFFLNKDYLLRRISRLKMPVFIVQGRYDVVTPPASAWAIHKRLPRSKLVFTVAGHSSSDEDNSREILRIMKKL